LTEISVVAPGTDVVVTSSHDRASCDRLLPWLQPGMMTTGFHGVENAEIGFELSVAVLGIGAVGLMAIAAAKLHGAGRLIGVDLG
jgi:threonine dehydrogenase-like Zn-dependent dehydrogenase